MRTAVVTGANGFIGSNLCKELSENDTKVFAIVRGNNYSKINKNNNVETISCDLKNIEDLPGIIGKADTFYHLGWGGVFGKESDDYLLQSDNIKYTCNAVGASEEMDCARFIYVNSLMAYGSINSVSRDCSKPSMRNIYYVAKETAHIMAKTICFDKGIRYVGATIANIYGPGSNIQGFVNSILMKMIKGEVARFTSGDQNYDFMYITDAVSALRSIGEMEKPFCSYYVGSESQLTIKEYVNLMKQYSGSKSELEFGGVSTPAIGIDKSLLNTRKLKEDLGFESTVDFEMGIKKTVEWLKETDHDS